MYIVLKHSNEKTFVSYARLRVLQYHHETKTKEKKNHVIMMRHIVIVYSLNRKAILQYRRGGGFGAAVRRSKRFRISHSALGPSCSLALIPLYQVAQTRLSKRKFSSLQSSTIHHWRSLSGSGCGCKCMLRPRVRPRLSLPKRR
jgi:hypothetical protein